MSTSASPNSKVVSLHRTTSIPDEDFLLFLGKRVRQLRNLRGITRKTVAQESDVSERHLAQLEAGEGNVSIVLLRRIAAALNASLAELFAPEAEEPTEKQVIRRFLELLPNHRLEDVVFRLMRLQPRGKRAPQAYRLDWPARSRQVNAGIETGTGVARPFHRAGRRN